MIPKKLPALALFGGSFLPPGNHHLAICEALLQLDFIDEVLVVPCGPRPDKSYAFALPWSLEDRTRICELAFSGMGAGAARNKLRLDLSDLAASEYTRTWTWVEKLSAGAEVWIVVGEDLLGSIRSSWYRGEELWRDGKFLVLRRPGTSPQVCELPSQATWVDVSYPGSSSEIREKLARGESVLGLLPRAVSEYLERRGLI